MLGNMIPPIYAPNGSGGFGITGSPSAGWTATKTGAAGTAFAVRHDTLDAVLDIDSATADKKSRLRLLEAGAERGYLEFDGLANNLRLDSDYGMDLSTNNTVRLTISAVGAFTFITQATASAGETLASYGISDSALRLTLQNINVTDTEFVPAFLWPTNGASAPTFTTRGSGTRLVFRNTLDASTVDFAIGYTTNIQWYSVGKATSSYEHAFYAGTTKVANIRGDGLLTTTGGRIVKLRVALTTPVTLAATDYVIVSNLTTPGAVAVNLPAGPTAGYTFVIKDGKGDANVNNITITPAAGNIDGAGTLVLNTAYARCTLVYNGTEWNRID